MKRIILIALISLPVLLGAQSGVFAKIVDDNEIPLPGATGMLLNQKDSILIGFGISDQDGVLKIPALKKGEYILQITYLGYQKKEFTKSVEEDNVRWDLGTVALSSEITALSEVVIQGDRNPVMVKKDTIEYDVKSFGTAPNASVEELLKRLPGVEVDREGNVKAQGENVPRILVDGKEFFGRDPKIATRNLPADAVDKVQVFDKKSDQAEFSGIDDGERERTINLALKADRKSGYFGNVKGGYGDKGRFDGKASINRFDKSQQVSFLGQANNINQEGFSFNDYLNFQGGAQNFMQGGNFNVNINSGPGGNGFQFNNGRSPGFVDSYAGGMNFNKDFSEKTKLQSSYFYNQSIRETDQSVRRENFLDAGNRFISQESADQLNRSGSHRITLILDQKIDSFQSLKLNSSIGLGIGKGNSTGVTSNFGIGGVLQNENSRKQDQNSERIFGNNNLLYRLRSRTTNRNLTVSTTLNFGDNDRSSFLEAENKFVRANLIEIDSIYQERLQKSADMTLGVQLNYTEPLSKKIFLESIYSANSRKNESDQTTYDINLGREVNPFLTNSFESTLLYHRAGMNLRYSGKDLTASGGFNVQSTQLNGRNATDLIDFYVDRKFLNLLPSARLRYSLATSRNLTLDYDTGIREPSITQLQPQVDNSNPFNIFQGNPDLQPEFQHRLNFRFISFSQFTLTNIFLNFSAIYTDQKITNSRFTDEFFITTTTPLNLGNDLVLNTNVNFGTTLRNLGVRFNINGGVIQRKGFNLINDIKNQTITDSYTGTFRLDNRKKQKIDVGGGVTLNYQKTSYSLQSSLNQSFFNQTYFSDLIINFSKGWTFTGKVDYQVFNGITTDFRQEIPILNSGISKLFLKNDKGQLSLNMVDMLNRNLGVTQRTDLNFIEEERIRSLGRYVMLSFTYSLRGFKQEASGSMNTIMIRN
jgi:hypothetical protein